MATSRSGTKTMAQRDSVQDALAKTAALVVVMRGEEGVVDYVSPGMHRVLGRRDVDGLPMRKAFPELNGQGWFECVEEMYASGKSADGGGIVVSFIVGGKPAREALYTFSLEPCLDDDGNIGGVTAVGIRVNNQYLMHQRSAEEQERYHAFMQNSNIGIWRFELDAPIPTGLPVEEQVRLTFERAYLAEANDAMASMYGYETAAPIIGARLGDLMIQDDPKNIGYLTAFVDAGYRLTGVDSHEKDYEGNDKYFRNSLVGVIKDGRIVRAWGTQQDITEQYLAVQAMRKSEERLELALKASHLGTWEWNLASNELTWSDELRQLYGLNADDEVSYETFINLLHPDCRDELQANFQHSLETGDSYEVEHKIVWSNGEVHWILGRGRAILVDGKPVRMLGTGMNIDDRKRAELQLRESEARFRSMADNAPVLIWESDAKARCTYLNQPWLQFTGRSLKSSLGNGWTDDIHPDDRPLAGRAYRDASRNHEPFCVEFRVKNRDGAYRLLLDKGEPRFSSDGEFLGYIGSCIDIQDIRESQKLKSMNTTLKTQRTQLLALNRSKDEFISLASHQLRTPATGVKQYIGMLLEGYSGDLTEDQTELLRIAYESNERQLQIIDDLLKVAHIDAGKVELKMQPTDLAGLIQDVIKEQRDTFRKRRQRVIFKPEQPAVMVCADAPRIRMVIENLVDNAGKYSPEGRDVTIAIEAGKDDVVIGITDQGVGIAEADIGKLFQKFSRVNNPLSTLVGGTGIGLYWAKKIIDMHHGSIGVTSQLHKGSTFTIRLPKGDQ